MRTERRRCRRWEKPKGQRGIYPKDRGLAERSGMISLEARAVPLQNPGLGRGCSASISMTSTTAVRHTGREHWLGMYVRMH